MTTQVLPNELELPPEKVDYAVAYLSAESLKRYEVFDTPGLGGETEIAQGDSAAGETRITRAGAVSTRRILIDRTSTDESLPAPDVTVLLCDQEPKSDELDFLQQMGASRVDTVARVCCTNR